MHLSASLRGWICHCSGPWVAIENDAKIFETELTKNEEMRNFFSGYYESYDGDTIFLLDRGYRDVLSLLDELGYKYEIPSMLYDITYIA